MTLTEEQLLTLVRVYHGFKTDAAMVEALDYGLELNVEKMRQAFAAISAAPENDPVKALAAKLAPSFADWMDERFTGDWTHGKFSAPDMSESFVAGLRRSAASAIAAPVIVKELHFCMAALKANSAFSGRLTRDAIYSRLSTLAGKVAATDGDAKSNG